MKKALILIGSLLLSSVFFFGCGSLGSACGGATVEPISANKPWNNSNNYEYASYDVTRYAAVQDESGRYVESDEDATGTYTTELFTLRENIYESEIVTQIGSVSEYFTNELLNKNALSSTAGWYSVLFTEYELNYESGKTDTQSSVVLFKTSSLLPVFSAKTVNYETSGLTYTATSDYVNKINYFESSETGGKVETELREEDGSFDNELLYHVVRAHTSLIQGGSSTISMRNAVYTGLNNAEEYRTMVFQVAEGDYTITGIDPDKNGFVSRYFEEGDIKYNESDGKDENGNDIVKGYEIPCYYTSMAYSNNNSGPPKYLFYSASGFDYVGDTTSKVLLQTIDYEMDAEGVVSHMNVMKIKDYKTSKNM